MNNEAPRCTKIDLARFLADRQMIDESAVEAVRHRSATERTPIGQILVMRGLLTVRQVMNLLELQSETPTVRFGELAVRVGYLTTLQLEDALRFQRTHRRHQIEIVFQEGLLSKADLDSAVVGYVQFLELQNESFAEAA